MYALQLYPVLGLNNAATFGLKANNGNMVNYTVSYNSGARENVTLGLSNINTIQVYQYQSNAFGHVIQSIDPVGRQFNYLYDGQRSR